MRTGWIRKKVGPLVCVRSVRTGEYTYVGMYVDKIKSRINIEHKSVESACVDAISDMGSD